MCTKIASTGDAKDSVLTDLREGESKDNKMNHKRNYMCIGVGILNTGEAVWAVP